jgi:glycosyltransferase involved in cell wall biosynthesis
MARTFLVVSASPDAQMQRRIAEGRSPRKDYLELSRVTGGEIIYRESVSRRPLSRIVARLFGVPAGQAMLAFLCRRDYDAIFTDAENIGLPLALLFKLGRVRRHHVMIGHLLSTRIKGYFFRYLKVQSHIDAIICHASRQHWILEHRLNVPPDRLALMPYQIDERFWRPLEETQRRQICSAGLEFRDYRSLIEAVRGLDIDVVIAAASHWSKRRNDVQGVTLPKNVQTTSLNYEDLRTLYAHSLFVVVPVEDVEFQAGITVILEAMGMARAVVVTRTRGQTDVVRDANGWSSPTEPDALSAFPDVTVALEGVDPGQNGVYVPPGDASALRMAIAHLAAHPKEAARMGANGRLLVERTMTLDQYVARIVALLDQTRPQSS